MKYSGFSMGHNLIHAGYPIREAVKAVSNWVDEVVFVDCESTDGTALLMEALGCRVINGKWGDKAGETLAAAHALHTECRHDNILHFEADEVFDEIALHQAVGTSSIPSACFYRIQIGFNFQRCLWYPTPVHRIFQKGTVKKVGESTNVHKSYAEHIPTLLPDYGYLWDCPSTCRDNWIPRMEQQARLWGHEPKFRVVPQHFLGKTELTREEAEEFLNDPLWTWAETPFKIPNVLKPLVGKTRYE